MTSGYFPHYGAGPAELEGAAAHLERSAGSLDALGPAVHLAHAPARTGVAGVLTEVMTEAPRCVLRNLRQVMGAALVAAGAVRLFGRAVDSFNARMDELEAEWQEAVASDRAASITDARGAKLHELQVRLWGHADDLNQSATVAATHLEQGPTTETLQGLFAAGVLPSGTVAAFPGIRFTHVALPSDIDRMTDQELAAYALAHPEQSALLIPVLSDAAKQLMAQRIDELSQGPYAVEQLVALATAYGFNSSTTMRLVFGGDSISNAELAEAVRDDPALLDDEQVCAVVEGRIVALDAADGAADGATMRDVIVGDASAADAQEAMGDLALVSAYGTWAQLHARPAAGEPYLGADYLTGFYYDLEMGGDDPVILAVGEWLGDDESGLGAETQAGLQQAYADGLLQLPDAAVHATYFPHEPIPPSVMEAVSGGGEYHDFAEMMSHATVHSDHDTVRELWESGRLPFYAPLVFTNTDLTMTPTTAEVAHSLEAYFRDHPDARYEPYLQILQSTVLEPPPSQAEIDESIARLRDAGVLGDDEEPDDYFLSWLEWSLRKGLGPEDIVERAEQEEVAMQSFDPLRESGVESIMAPDGRLFFLIPDDVGAKDIVRASELFHGGLPSITDERRSNNEWTYDGWMASESYVEMELNAGGAIVATPDGTVMVAPGPDGAVSPVDGGGTTWMEMFVLNESFDDPEAGLREWIAQGTDDGGHHGDEGDSRAQLLMHERLHTAQWAAEGYWQFMAKYGWEHMTSGHAGGNDYEMDAIADWGGYGEATPWGED